MNALQKINMREATRDDVIHIVKMLADDSLGAKREQYSNPLIASYYLAFDDINADCHLAG